MKSLKKFGKRKINFLTPLDYSSWGSKNRIDSKNNMQVEVDVKCMQTNFGGHGLFGFRDLASFCLPSKTAKTSLRTMDYSPWGSKNRIGSKNSCK